MMKMLPTFLSLFITGIAFVSAQELEVVTISSGAAPTGTKCLAASNPSLADGTPVEIYDCNQSRTQQWQIGYPGSGYTQVMIAGSNTCLEAGDLDSSSKVVIAQCNQAPPQQWNYTETDQFTLLYNSDFCLDLPNFSTKNGNEVGTYPCNGGKNQIWNTKAIN